MAAGAVGYLTGAGAVGGVRGPARWECGRPAWRVPKIGEHVTVPLAENAVAHHPLDLAPSVRSFSASPAPWHGMSSSITLRIKHATRLRSLANASQPSRNASRGFSHRRQTGPRREAVSLRGQPLPKSGPGRATSYWQRDANWRSRR